MDNFVLKYSKWIIAVTLLAVVASIAVFDRLRTEVDFSDYFPENDPEYAFYSDFREKMGGSDEWIYVAIRPEKQIYDTAFLTKVHELSLAVERLPNVRNVLSLTKLTYAVKSPFGFISIPYLHFDDAAALHDDSLKIERDSHMFSLLISHVSKALILPVHLKKHLGHKQASAVMTSLDSLTGQYGFQETHIAGRKRLEVQYRKLLGEELALSLLLSAGIIVLILWWLFRTPGGVLIPLLSMVAGLILLYGFIAATGRTLGIMSNLFPTIMLIVGISDIIHIANRYELELARGAPKKEAIRLAVKEMQMVTFLTSFTTAVGFLTLLTSSMPVLRSFGLEAALGVMLAYGISILFVPSVLLHLNNPFHLHSWLKKWPAIAGWMDGFVIRKQGLIKILTGVLLAVSAIGIANINTNNRQLTNIPKGEKLQRDYRFFEDSLGGIRTYEIALLPAAGHRLDELAVLQNIKKLHLHLDSVNMVSKIYSPVTYYAAIHRTYRPAAAHFDLPESDEELSRQESAVLKFTKNLNETSFMDSIRTTGRMFGSMQDIGRQNVRAFNKDLRRWADTNLDTSLINLHFTGTDLLIDRGHEHRVSNMLFGLMLALLAVAITIGLVFRSIRAVVIVLVANIVPLLLLGGVMGFSGIELRGTSSILFTVGFVIAVDDTIHFLSKFRLERMSGHSVEEAISNTLHQAGKAMVLTTVILFGGFFILLQSGFWDVYVLAILVSAMLLIALIVDLFLVPILIRSWWKQ